MVVGRGGGTIVVEVDDLETMSCGIGASCSQARISISFRESSGRGGMKGELKWYGVRGFPNLLAVCRFSLIVVTPIVRIRVGFALAIAGILASDGASCKAPE